jgi:hypothetical protein
MVSSIDRRRPSRRHERSIGLFFRNRVEAAIRMRSWLSRPETALFMLVLGAYAYFYQAGGWNQNSRFDLTRAIVEERTSTIDHYAYNTGDLSCRGPHGRCQQARAEAGEHYYSDKAPGLSWLAVPAYAVAYAAFGSERPGRRYLSMSAWWVTVIAVGVPGAMAVVMLYLTLAAFTRSETVRITITLAYGLATLAFPYSTLYYGHQVAAALLLMSFALLVLAKRCVSMPPTPGLLVGVGLMLGYAVVVDYMSAMAVVPLMGYVAAFVRPWRRLGWLVAGETVPGIALGAYHWLVFGGPLTMPYEFSTQMARHIGFMGLGSPSPYVLREILIGSYRGLFYSAPWLLLAIPGAMSLLWRRGRRAEGLVCSVIATLFLWLNSSLVDWQGGWAFGPRYLVPAIPFLSVLVVGCVPNSRPRGFASRACTIVGSGLALVLVAVSGVLMLVGTAVKPEAPMDIQRPFGEYLWPSFLRGELSINTQSVEDLWPQVKGKPQAWNASQLAGLDGLASLVPLGVYVAVTSAWLVWIVSRRPNAGTDSVRGDLPTGQRVRLTTRLIHVDR